MERQRGTDPDTRPEVRQKPEAASHLVGLVRRAPGGREIHIRPGHKRITRIPRVTTPPEGHNPKA